MSFYSDHILPRGINWAMAKPEFGVERERLVPRVEGRVLEIGFGSGLNLPYYTDNVTQLFALDPATLGQKLARQRLAACSFPVEFVELRDDCYALDSGSVDVVLSTWTMCTIPDLSAALAEIRRVLVPGGQLHFLEHGRASKPSTARWQKRLNPFQKLFAGGCKLDVDHSRVLRDAGYEILELENTVMSPGALFGSLYKGIATPAE